MSRRTTISNPQLKVLLGDLKKKAIEDGSPIWKRVASDLERPLRNRRAVNLSRINRFSKENEIVLVPGKVLGSGVIDHKITIAAFSFSSGALEKLKQQKCDAMSIRELIAKNPKKADIRIIG